VGINLWIGEQAALDPKFVHDANFDGLLILTTSDQQPKRSVLSRWVKDEMKIRHMILVDDRIDDDDSSTLSWNRLTERMRDILDFIAEMQKVEFVVIIISTVNALCRSRYRRKLLEIFIC
jgi:hypothetical protein